MAIPAAMKENKSAFRFLDKDFLNVAYLTGFARNRDKVKKTFELQQTGNEETMVTIHVGEKDNLPAEFKPVTVMAHIFGETHEDGSIHLRVNAIDISDPSKLAMPTHIAWSGIGANGKKAFNLVPPGVKVNDEFQPFAENGELKEAVAKEVSAPNEGYEIIKELLEVTRGRMDSRLGENSNVVMATGMIEKAMIVPATEFTKEFIAMLVRQHADESKCIPVRFYPNTKVGLEVHMRDLKPGYPVKIVGQVRKKLIKGGGENGEEITDRQMYLRCYEARTPMLGKEIFTKLDPSGAPVLPQWVIEKSKALLTAHKERRMRLNDVAKQGNALRIPDEQPRPKVDLSGIDL